MLKHLTSRDRYTTMSTAIQQTHKEPMLHLIKRKAAACYQLTKPGIIRLLVLTTVCTMVVASGGAPDLGLLLWTLLGTAMVCGLSLIHI